MQSPSFTVKSQAVRAGAGAGKTYNLTHKVLDFVDSFHKHQGKFPHVMVTTFTKKATQELSERLIKLALEKYPHLVDYVSSPGYFSVSTIHGVLDKFLKKYGYQMGLNSDFSYFKNSEIGFNSKRILKNLIEDNADFQKLMHSFSFTYLHEILMESVAAPIQGARVLKTEDLENLLKKELQSVKKSLDGFILELQGEELPGKWTDFFKNLQKVQSHLSPNSWLTARAEYLTSLDEITLVGLKSKKESVSLLYYDRAKELVEELRELKGPLYDSGSFEHIGELHRSFALLQSQFAAAFGDFKKHANKIEISDLEPLSDQLIEKFPESAALFAQSKDFWLIDEFQDTSPLQMRILHALVGDRPTYIVGDPQQSIYLFRGARSEVFHERADYIVRKGGEQKFLDTNYRSSPPLLELMNRISLDLGEGFQSMKSAFADEEHPPTVAHISILQKADDKSEAAESDEQGSTDDKVEEVEVQHMAEQILKLKREGASYDGMAILLRKNKQLEKVAQVLRAYNIPIYIHSAGFFWRRREVKDVLCLLKFFINPNDDYNLTALLRSPFIAITEQQLADLVVGRTENVWRTVKNSLRDGKLGLSGQRLYQLYDEKENFGLRVTLLKALNILGFFDFHLKYDVTGRAEGNLWKFVHLLKSFESERGASYVDFVNEAEKAAVNERSLDAPGSVQPNKVNLMTVHASKGLQFDHVFLPFLGEGAYRENKMNFIFDEEDQIWSIRTPSSEFDLKSTGSLFEKKVIQYKQKREAEEDRRVFYVAYTRAKKFLFMSWEEPVKPKSWADMLKLDVSSGLHEMHGFSYTVEKMLVGEKSGAELPSSPGSAEIVKPYGTTRLDYYNHADEASQSVTALINEGPPNFYQRSFIKKRQGTLFHKILELLRYPENTDFRAIISNWFAGEEAEVSSALNYILNHQDPPYVKIIKQGEVEWPFVMKNEEGQHTNRRIEGKIDLWGIVDDELWVVDYKSGSKVLKEKAFEQLTMYANALKKHLHWKKPIKLVVVYPFLKEEFIKEIP